MKAELEAIRAFIADTTSNDLLEELYDTLLGAAAAAAIKRDGIEHTEHAEDQIVQSLLLQLDNALSTLRRERSGVHPAPQHRM